MIGIGSSLILDEFAFISYLSDVGVGRGFPVEEAGFPMGEQAIFAGKAAVGAPSRRAFRSAVRVVGTEHRRARGG